MIKSILAYSIQFLFLFSLSLPCFSQNINKIEFDDTHRIIDYHIIPNREQGFIVHHFDSKKILSKTKSWRFFIYDTLLKIEIDTSFQLENKLNYVGYDFDKDTCYMLFQSYSYENIGILKLFPSSSGKIISYQEFPSFKRVSVNDFKVFNRNLFLYGEMLDKNTVIYHQINTAESSISKILPTSEDIHDEIVNFNWDSLTNEIHVSSMNWRGGQSTIHVSTFNELGEKVNFTSLNSTSKQRINDAKPLFNKDKLVIVGTYSKGNRDEKNGIYTYSQNEKIQFYPFSEFDSYFAYLDSIKRTKQENKIKRKLAKGKTINVEDKILFHDIIPFKDNYALVFEAYIPEYKYNSPLQNTLRYNSMNNLTPMYREFDYYKYSHALVVLVDKEGKKIADQSIKVDNKSISLQQIVGVYSDKDSLTLFQVKEDEFIKNSFDYQLKTNSKEEFKLPILYPDDEIKTNNNIYTRYWYSKYAITFGYQYIANKTEDQKNKRYVYMIAKIEL